MKKGISNQYRMIFSSKLNLPDADENSIVKDSSFNEEPPITNTGLHSEMNPESAIQKVEQKNTDHDNQDTGYGKEDNLSEERYD